MNDVQTSKQSPQLPPLSSALIDREWSAFVDKVTQSALLLISAKLVSAWVCAGLWSMPLRSRFIWGVIPYAGVQTNGADFRTLAAWSTAITSVVAVLWALAHFFPRRTSSGRMWGGFAALPMSVFLAGLEWYRKFDADNLLPSQWLLYIAIGVMVPAVLIIGFVEPVNRQSCADTSPAVQSAATRARYFSNSH